MDRWDVERALRASDLPPLARLVAWALLSRANAGTAIIPAQFSPSLAAIARDTGLSKSTVALHLNALESGGWVTRVRSNRAAAEHVPTTYRMHHPASPGDGLVRETDKGASPSHGLGLVRETDQASPSHGHNQISTRPKPEQKKSAPADPYLHLPGFVEFWSAYPRKTAKRTAANAYRGALNRAGDSQLIIKGAVRYASDPGRVDAYTKHPATWLNGDCWADDPLPPPGANGHQAETDAQFARQLARAHARELDDDFWSR